VDDLDRLAAGWLSLPTVAERLGCTVGEVRRLLRDRHLLASRQPVDGRPVLAVPEDLLAGDEPLADLRGTVTVLADSGFTDDQALRWLLTPDDSLPGRPVEALRAGRRTEVRRRAQALAF
jgi:hypothetical protein